jgi:hypothetical protein
MTASWRLAVTIATAMMLTIPTAALVCVPLGLSAGWLCAVCASVVPLWAWIVDRAIRKAEAARNALQGAPRGVCTPSAATGAGLR